MQSLCPAEVFAPREYERYSNYMKFRIKAKNFAASVTNPGFNQYGWVPWVKVTGSAYGCKFNYTGGESDGSVRLTSAFGMDPITFSVNPVSGNMRVSAEKEGQLDVPVNARMKIKADYDNNLGDITLYGRCVISHGDYDFTTESEVVKSMAIRKYMKGLPTRLAFIFGNKMIKGGVRFATDIYKVRTTIAAQLAYKNFQLKQKLELGEAKPMFALDGQYESDKYLVSFRTGNENMRRKLEWKASVKCHLHEDVKMTAIVDSQYVVRIETNMKVRNQAKFGTWMTMNWHLPNIPAIGVSFTAYE